MRCLVGCFFCSVTIDTSIRFNQYLGKAIRLAF